MEDGPQHCAEAWLRRIVHRIAPGTVVNWPKDWSWRRRSQKRCIRFVAFRKNAGPAGFDAVGGS